MERKVIQIAATDAAGNKSSIVYALCDDGTMWVGYWARGGFEWEQIPNVSQPEEVE